VHADVRREAHGLAGATVDLPPHRQPSGDAAAVVRRPARVGDDLVGGAVDLEHRHRPRRSARRQRPVAAGDSRDPRELVGELATHARGHAAAVRHAGDEHARGVHARHALELAQRALERLDVVARTGDRAAHVPERVRPSRRGVGDEEALAVGQGAEAGVLPELGAGLAGAVQRDHERQRVEGAARHVEVHLAHAVRRVDAHEVVARAERRARLVGGRRGVVDCEGRGPPRDERDDGQPEHDRPRGPRLRAAQAKTQPRHSAKVRSVTAGRMATSPSRRGRYPWPTTIQTASASRPAASACTAT